jgi:hypothetical protein
MDALASQMGANKSPAEEYVLGGAEAPQVPPQNDVETVPAVVRYAASESRRPLEQQPLARTIEPPEKKGWSIFGRKKAAPEMRAEPLPEALRAPAPRATAQVMPSQQAPQPQPQELPRNNADDLFPDHKRDEQFEIPAFLRRQSN